jgi:hypothetical protein
MDSLCSIFAAPMKEQHLAIRSAKDTQHDRSVALAHKTQAAVDVKAAKARLTALRSSGKPEAVLQVWSLAQVALTHVLQRHILCQSFDT